MPGLASALFERASKDYWVASVTYNAVQVSHELIAGEFTPSFKDSLDDRIQTTTNVWFVPWTLCFRHYSLSTNYVGIDQRSGSCLYDNNKL